MRGTKIPIDTIRESIANELSTAVKSYEIPAVCVRLGIQTTVEESDASEAHSSKRTYVRKRLLPLPEALLLKIAQQIVTEFGAPGLADLLSEITIHGEQRLSELSRRDALKALNHLDSLFGDLPLFESLNIFATEPLARTTDFTSHSTFTGLTLSKELEQHYIRNDDLSHEDVAIKCGALNCSQNKFFAFLEKLVDPLVRRGDQQADLAELLNPILRRDGFEFSTIGSTSGYPIYRIQKIALGVGGSVKNIIFASIGEKPELIFRDAVNNDVEIVKHGDKVLIFDRPFPLSGALVWADLVSWWQALTKNDDPVAAKSELYKRLKQSVLHSRSPGELAIFHTYYSVFGRSLGDNLPVLIPQVYLHYDPYTKRERGDQNHLVRQRMDFLMLLEQGIRIVIEVDGRQHYGEPDPHDRDRYRASPSLYARMVEEDRLLRLLGYEVYRFGGSDFHDTALGNSVPGPASRQVAEVFFSRLLRKHGVQ